MNAYEFMPKLPSNGSVSSLVTHVVSAWFLVAAGAILADPPSPYTQRAVPQAMARTPAQAPSYRETIMVAANTSGYAPVRETITVIGRRSPQGRAASL